jgi:apolipoprotein N-acyltransferase
MDFARLWIATACSTVLFYFGTGLSPLPVLAWLAPLPVLLMARRVPGWAAAVSGFIVGFVGSTNFWSWSAGSHDLALLPWGLLVSFGFGGTFALAVTLFRLLPPMLAVLTAPAAWVSVLYLAAVLNPMGIQGTLATSQADVPIVMQTASVLGAWGVEYLVFFVPATIAVLRLRAAILLGIVAVVVLGGGALRLSTPAGPSQRVALIDSNQKGWAADLRTAEGRDLLAAYIQQINALPAGIKTVVLPEATFGSDEKLPAALAGPMQQIAHDRGFTIVVGYAHWTPTAKYNYALSFPTAATYLKHHDTVSPPGNSLTFASDGIGIAICMDVNFRSPSASYAAAGAKMLAIPASDEDANGWQHSRTALLRGVENGMAIAWGGRQTELMLSDGWGRVLASQPTGNPGSFTVVMADVPTGPGATIYTHLGDWFAWLCLALTVFGPVAVKHRQRTSRPAHGNAENPAKVAVIPSQ